MFHNRKVVLVIIVFLISLPNVLMACSLAPMEANFTANVASGTIPLSVEFEDLSQGALDIDSWSWKFGDGSTSSEQRPVHIYETSGVFSVSLTVRGAYVADDWPAPEGGNCVCIDCDFGEITKEDFIQIPTPILTPTPAPVPTSPPHSDHFASIIADFSASPTKGLVPLKVEFQTLSFDDLGLEHPGEFFWDFGDGQTSVEASPVHTYTETGTYTVFHSAGIRLNKGDFCEGTCEGSITKSNFIEAFDITITVEPNSVRSSARPQRVVVKIIDQSGDPKPGVDIKTIINGQRVSVKPSSAVTGADGTAEFDVRFGFITKDGEVTFTADGLEATVTQK